MLSRADRVGTGGVALDWKFGISGPAARPDARAPAPSAAAAVDYAQADDVVLARACAEGALDAFDVVVERHQRQIYQVCYRYAGNHEDAADLAQEVFLRAYRGIRHFKGESALGTWLYRIALNVCASRAASKDPPAEPLDDLTARASTVDDPVGPVIEAERARRVRRAIARLPRRQRAVLVLRVYQELSHKEIARVLGSSVGAVKANFFHALRNLKKLLDVS